MVTKNTKIQNGIDNIKNMMKEYANPNITIERLIHLYDTTGPLINQWLWYLMQMCESSKDTKATQYLINQIAEWEKMQAYLNGIKMEDDVEGIACTICADTPAKSTDVCTAKDLIQVVSQMAY
jgi:hypothetical protein